MCEPLSWLGTQDSNLDSWLQRPESYRWTSSQDVVPLEGFEPSASRVRAGCTSRCATEALVGPEGVEPPLHRVKAGCHAVRPRAHQELTRGRFNLLVMAQVTCPLYECRAQWGVKESNLASETTGLQPADGPPVYAHPVMFSRTPETTEGRLVSRAAFWFSCWSSSPAALHPSLLQILALGIEGMAGNPKARIDARRRGAHWGAPQRCGFG